MVKATGSIKLVLYLPPNALKSATVLRFAVFLGIHSDGAEASSGVPEVWFHPQNFRKEYRCCLPIAPPFRKQS